LHFKNRKSRNNNKARMKRALQNNGEEKTRIRKNKKRGAGVQTGRSSKLNHMRNLARSSEPEKDDADEEEG
jgi:hypothetical protein